MSALTLLPSASAWAVGSLVIELKILAEKCEARIDVGSVVWLRGAVLVPTFEGTLRRRFVQHKHGDVDFELDGLAIFEAVRDTLLLKGPIVRDDWL